jgi:hypothetical protein
MYVCRYNALIVGLVPENRRIYVVEAIEKNFFREIRCFFPQNKRICCFWFLWFPHNKRKCIFLTFVVFFQHANKFVGKT